MTDSENIATASLKYKLDDLKDWLDSLQKKEDYNLSEIKSKIEGIFECAGGYSKDFFYHSFITDGLYRARKHKEGEDLFFWTKDFWYRDWMKEPMGNWRYDRLNMPGESVWYFSNRIKACIAEIRPQKDDIISVANIKQFTFPRRFNYFLHLGSASLGEGDSNLKNMNNEADKNRNSKLPLFKRENLQLIDDFLDEIFHREIPEGEPYKYIPSIAISHILRQSSSGIMPDGIVYPSVAFKKEAVNIAFLNPKLDEFNFYLYQAIQFKVTKAERDKYYAVEPVWVGKNIHENQYGNFPICWQKPRQEEIDKYCFPIEINPTSCT